MNTFFQILQNTMISQRVYSKKCTVNTKKRCKRHSTYLVLNGRTIDSAATHPRSYPKDRKHSKVLLKSQSQTTTYSLYEKASDTTDLKYFYSCIHKGTLHIDLVYIYQCRDSYNTFKHQNCFRKDFIRNVHIQQLFQKYQRQQKHLVAFKYVHVSTISFPLLPLEAFLKQ